jgi:NADH dehydrogenase (ubiquinone) 1 alpha subcomplex subunit 13
MALPPTTKFPKQDMPPPGGYPPLDISKRLPGPRMSGVGLIALVGGVMAVGFYKVAQGNQERRGWKNEKRDIRASLLPYLQAEEDARFVQVWDKRVEQEGRIMKGVEGWIPGQNVYETGVWMPPGDNRFG